MPDSLGLAAIMTDAEARAAAERAADEIDAEDRFHQLEQAQVLLRQENSELVAERAALVAERDSLRTSAREAKADAEAAKEEARRLEQQVRELGREVSLGSDARQHIDRNVQMRDEQLRIVERQLADANGKVLALTRAARDASDALAGAQAAQRAAELELARMRHERGALERRAEAAERDAVERAAELGAARAASATEIATLRGDAQQRLSLIHI